MKNEMLNKLFSIWEYNYSRNNIDRGQFSKDGIIDEDLYDCAPKKLLFVIRETNDFAEGDLRVLYKDGPKHQMAAQLSKWAAGIFHNFPDFDKVDNDIELRNKAMQMIALLNLKKYSGGPTVDFNLLNAFSLFDKEFIKIEIDIINPDIIICCNTFIEFMWTMDLKSEARKLLKLGVNNNDIFNDVYYYNGKRVIAWPHHPSDRKSHKENYNELQNYFNARIT